MKWTLAPLVLAALAAGSWLLARQPDPLLISQPPTAKQPGEHQYLGAATCSAASCHGANGREGSKSSEYSTWADHDAHNRAYSVLFDKRSVNMARNLGLDKPAHESAVCLKCHGTLPPDHLRGNRFQASDGVSCEGCHGPAQHWLAEHYLPGWKTLSAVQKEALGFQNTKNLLIRARQCVDCHVGKGDADVNHDLLAAGHPRLQFEFNAFLAAVPKHWSEQDEKARYPDLEARAWLVGQAVTTRASLELLAERTKHVWPEFAEHDCRACHHDLNGAPTPTANLARSGAAWPLRWNDSYAALFPRALVLGGNGDTVFNTIVDNLRKEMGMPRPDAAKAAQLAGEAAGRIGGLAEQFNASKPLSATAIRRQFVELVNEPARIQAGDENARQRYRALVAFYRTLQDLAPQQVDPRWQPQLQRFAEESKEPLRRQP